MNFAECRVRPQVEPRSAVPAGCFVLFMATSLSAQSAHGVWFAKAGANGDGASISSPVGSTERLERATRAGDLIVLLPGEKPFEGGISLKPGQVVIGLSESGRKPVMTNGHADRNGGHGIVLAGDNRIWNLRIENTHASGIFGSNVSGTWIDQVEVIGANRSGASVDPDIRALAPTATHGGIVFIASGPNASIVNHIIRSQVTDAAGHGVETLAIRGAKSRLAISETQVEKGAAVGASDVGVSAAAQGPSATTHLQLEDSKVGGRVSRSGRNVIIVAAAGARGSATINRSEISESGQDGVIAVAALIPATVDLRIRDSLIEKSAQTNVEGTILNVPAFDSSRAHETRVSIEIEDSTIRDSGAVKGFEGESSNVWIGSTHFIKAPFPDGSYNLTIRNSKVEGGRDYGIGIGNSGKKFEIAPEVGAFTVLLRDNTIARNGPAAIIISSPKAKVDARQNCWGGSGGLPESHVVLNDSSARAQLDASNPLPCAGTGSK